jgi:hypothetical protein
MTGFRSSNVRNPLTLNGRAGNLVRIAVEEGDTGAPGDELAILDLQADDGTAFTVTTNPANDVAPGLAQVSMGGDGEAVLEMIAGVGGGFAATLLEDRAELLFSADFGDGLQLTMFAHDDGCQFSVAVDGDALLAANKETGQPPRVGFFDVATSNGGAPKQSVTGSRGTDLEAVVTSLLAALAAYSLIDDDTTA